MFGRQRDRFAEAQRIGLREIVPGPRICWRRARRACRSGAAAVGDCLVARGDAGARIDDEQSRHRPARSRRASGRSCAPRQAAALAVRRSRRCRSGGRRARPAAHRASWRSRVTPGCRARGRVAARKAIEQRRFAHIGPADDGDDQGHGAPSGLSSAQRRRVPQADGFGTVPANGRAMRVMPARATRAAPRSIYRIATNCALFVSRYIVPLATTGAI